MSTKNYSIKHFILIYREDVQIACVVEIKYSYMILHSATVFTMRKCVKVVVDVCIIQLTERPFVYVLLDNILFHRKTMIVFQSLHKVGYTFLLFPQLFKLHHFLNKGPCPDNQVVTPSSDMGKLICAPEVCKAPFSSLDEFIIQMFPHPFDEKDDGGSCLVMGTTGCCCSTTNVLSYNIFKRRGECVDLKDPTTPYYSSPELDAMIDEVFNKGGGFGKKSNLTAVTRIRERRYHLTQVPTSNSLGACQPGSGTSKCTNQLV